MTDMIFGKGEDEDASKGKIGEYMVGGISS